ncbi:MAG TPA: hypothetical protein VF434_15650, partial [Promineifilum sp.]
MIRVNPSDPRHLRSMLLHMIALPHILFQWTVSQNDAILKSYSGMTGFDGEGWPWIASRARFTSRKTGSTR